MRQGVVVTVMMLTLTNCGPKEASSDTPGTQPSAAQALGDNAPPALEAPTPPPEPAKGRMESEKNDLFEFRYAYPAAAQALAPLKTLFDRKLDAAKADLVASSTSDRNDASKDGYPYRMHSLETEWKVVADLPDFLSLSTQSYQYTGGAHGMTAYETLVWDRRAQVARAPEDFFTAKDALRNAIQAPFCDLLDKQREQKRGEPVVRGSGQTFTECIDPVANTLILGSSNHKTFDRIGVLVAPYEAGPYAEGTYEVTVPVTAKVIAALKPQYRTSFGPVS
ncbi:hypothetical protein WSK_2507 [Novosphingobium sp. Rr 2-17]|uniref:DUF3298 and DUF4163 domain-containing protein n=1 Tax=Novosphingobium sp. Rr 2-17 TaxID=555793 RepID=UPI0002697B6E|nr:DUF3298 and DUF4163 domain-containing protein [Novosphingobium sp. Rr 2-17]EIZ78964.1 hypothetical protein WSK_2507 [Novosphingobium sp. Rr 2-17]